ncbi:MAG: transcription antitermination factor NusB [Bacteroidetes bacterium CG_4_8_14_3_um_filter_31_14]|nr:MAG: transcription antitermination factor NusB [Bacteroidetes bacterium CG_4_8_14_3_um_filter_31_14]
MLSRRLLRIKVMQMLYAYFTRDNKEIQLTEKELSHSIFKAFELYHYLLLLIIEIRDFTANKIEFARNKYRPSDKELNQSEKFINNSVIKIIENNQQYKKFLNNNKYSWVNNPELIRKIYNDIIESDKFNRYINSEKTGFNEDKQIIIDIYTNQISVCEELFNVLEEQSIYWNDDVEFIISMINKTISNFKENQSNERPLADMYKNDDDIDFVKTLFRKTITNHSDNGKLISQQTKNWEVERIAFMDMLLMEMAIVEATEMEFIPTKVTLNEYIEISKYYSTDKSSNFINGILDKMFIKLKSENKIVKKGRGLVGEDIQNPKSQIPNHKS